VDLIKTGSVLPSRSFFEWLFNWGNLDIRACLSILNLSPACRRQIFKGGRIMIEVGKQAPDFELVSHLAGVKFTLAQFKGQKNVMLVFYPLDWTPT
jgi:AhpC/TSA family protein